MNNQIMSLTFPKPSIRKGNKFKRLNGDPKLLPSIYHKKPKLSRLLED